MATVRETPASVSTEQGKSPASDASAEIDRILDSLLRVERNLFRVGVAVAVPVLVAAAILMYIRFGAKEEKWYMSLILTLMPSLLSAIGVGAAVFWVALLPEEKRARQAYSAAFSSTETRGIADQILAAIPAQTRGLASFERFRRKLGVIIGRFRCSVCDRRVKIERIGEVIRCRRCNSQVVVPTPECCPHCGSKTQIRIITPHEQVAPIKANEATAAGALIGGPAGVVAGGLLDAIYAPFKEASRDIRIATKRHLFYCENCTHKWAIKLPPRTGL